MADTEAKSNIPSKAMKKAMKDAYQGRGAFSGSGGFVGGAGGTQAKNKDDRQYAATGQRQPEGQKQGFLDNMRQRKAERDKEQQQQQYAQKLARDKQNEKRVASMAQGGLGRRLGVGALGILAGGNAGSVLGKNFGALAKSGVGINRGMGMMAEREAAFKRLNDKQRQAWKKEKGLKNKAKAFLKRKKKQQGIQAKDHSTFMWGFLISLALVKDLIDIGTLSLGQVLTWIIGVVWGFCTFFYLGRKNMEFADRIIKSLLPTLIDCVPLLGFLPILTFSVFYIWYRSEIATKLPAKPEEKKLPG
ncbi:MAG: hypothetical protein WC659_04515 [Patescibacteria group bacterium]